MSYAIVTGEQVTAEQVSASWEKWIKLLSVCKRIGRYYPGGRMPVNNCYCADCESWRAADKASEEYRNLQAALEQQNCRQLGIMFSNFRYIDPE